MYAVYVGSSIYARNNPPHTPAETGSVMGCKTDRQTNNTFPHTQEHTCFFLTWLLCLGTWRIIQNVEYLAGCMMGFEHVMLQLQFCALCVLECQVLIPLLTLKRQCHENLDPLFAKIFVSCGVCILHSQQLHPCGQWIVLCLKFKIKIKIKVTQQFNFNIVLK